MEAAQPASRTKWATKLLFAHLAVSGVMAAVLIFGSRAWWGGSDPIAGVLLLLLLCYYLLGYATVISHSLNMKSLPRRVFLSVGAAALAFGAVGSFVLWGSSIGAIRELLFLLGAPIQIVALVSVCIVVTTRSSRQRVINS